ncbi:hypothetical protein EBT31_16650 [bacterium]|nr:hypothetical protein [bacterium]
MKKGDVWGFISLILILGALAALFVFSPERREIIFQPLEVPGSALVLVEARKEGVIVDAVLGKPGFVTLHQRIGDAPGPLVATSSLLAEGIHSAFALSATGGLQELDSYVLLMVADDGDGVYEAGVDLPVMVNGTVIRVPVVLESEEEGVGEVEE